MAAKSVQFTIEPSQHVHIKGVTSSNPRLTAKLETTKPGEPTAICVLPADTTQKIRRDQRTDDFTASAPPAIRRISEPRPAPARHRARPCAAARAGLGRAPVAVVLRRPRARAKSRSPRSTTGAITCSGSTPARARNTSTRTFPARSCSMKTNGTNSSPPFSTWGRTCPWSSIAIAADDASHAIADGCAPGGDRSRQEGGWAWPESKHHPAAAAFVSQASSSTRA